MASSLPNKRYAFVLPRYFAGLAGGAETLASSLAQKLSGRGAQVEIWTTCAKDNRSWNNEFNPGQTVEGGLTIRRFLVDSRDLELWIPRQIKINDGMQLGIDDELLWMEHSVNSKSLYAHIAAHNKAFDAIFFAPYLFGTTFWGSLISPENSVLIPCLHDEHYAYTQVISAMFTEVRGVLFNSIPEQALARSLYGQIRGGEVGMGFEPFAPGYLDQLLPYFEDPFPYVLYLGRKETGKNAQVLIDYFIKYKESGSSSDLKLVICGGGSFSDLHRPNAVTRSDIIDLDHVSELDKHRLLRNALTLCQPSVNESFSIVLMESWLLGTPVVVHAGCAVTKDHCIRSGGGLYFRNEADFGAVLEELVENYSLRSELATAGYEYVLNRYGWSAVLERFDQVMTEIFGEPVAESDLSVSLK